MIIGDSLAQLIGGAPYSAVRVLRLAGYSACMGAAVGHYWHRWLEAHVHPEAPSSTQAVSAAAGHSRYRRLAGRARPTLCTP